MVSLCSGLSQSCGPFWPGGWDCADQANQSPLGAERVRPHQPVGQESEVCVPKDMGVLLAGRKWVMSGRDSTPPLTGGAHT